MYNDWLTIGPFTIHGYGVMIAIGVLSAVWLAEKLAKKFGLESDKIDSLAIFVVIFGYICSKAFYCILNWDTFTSNPAAVLGSGGWVVYAGIIGGVIGAMIWCKWHKWNFMDYFNVIMPVVSLAQGFGRIGCFLAGCCGGIETDAWYGVQFPASSLAWTTSSKIIPVQLISAAGDFLIFAFLYRMLMKDEKPKDTAGWYLILYGAGRFLIEFLRGDAERGFIGVLSTSQFISVFILLAGAYLIWHRQRQDEKKGEMIQ